MADHGERDEPSVLMVEDNDLVRDMCGLVLRESGRTILEVVSAAAALAELERPNVIRIVITDLNMPGAWSGSDLVRHLVTTRPDLGIVVTTGMTHPDLSFAPGVELVHKPFTVEQFLGAVERAEARP